MLWKHIKDRPHYNCDIYRQCDMGCLYCYADCLPFSCKKRWSATYEEIERVFHEKKGDMFHFGVMSDPFQEREYAQKLALHVLRQSNKHKVKLLIGTKAIMPEEHMRELDPDLHSFQFSFIGADDRFIRSFELGTPLFNERKIQMERLKSQGFDITLRLQPIIYIGKSLQALKELDGLYGKIKVEHLKLYKKNIKQFSFLDNIKYYTFNDNKYLLVEELRRDNIKKILAESRVDIKLHGSDRCLSYMVGRH